MVGASSDMGKDIISMLKLATKHVPEGAVTPAAARNEMDKAQLANSQNMQMLQRLRAAQAGQGGAPPAPSGQPQQPPPQPMPHAA